MFSGFWGWFLVIVLVVAVFSADRLPDFVQSLKEKAAEGAEAVKKGKKEMEEKIAQVKEKASKKEQEEDKED